MYQLIIYTAENIVDYLEDEQVGCLCKNSKAWPGNYVILTFKVSKMIIFQTCSKQTALFSVFNFTSLFALLSSQRACQLKHHLSFYFPFPVYVFY